MVAFQIWLVCDCSNSLAVEPVFAHMFDQTLNQHGKILPETRAVVSVGMIFVRVFA